MDVQAGLSNPPTLIAVGIFFVAVAFLFFFRELELFLIDIMDETKTPAIQRIAFVARVTIWTILGFGTFTLFLLSPALSAGN